MTKQIIYECDNFKIHQNKRDDDAIASFLYLPNTKNVAKFKYNGMAIKIITQGWTQHFKKVSQNC